MKYILYLTCLLLNFQLLAQSDIICEADSYDLFKKKIDEFYQKKYHELPNAERVTAIAKSFLNTTYVAKTLEIKPDDEKLTINLIGIDCTTFLEYVVAMNSMLKKNESSFEDFTKQLKFFVELRPVAQRR